MNLDRVEVNALTMCHIPTVAKFISKSGCYAVVTSTENMTGFIVERSKLYNKYRVILAIDFPSGKNAGLSKFYKTTDLSMVDGIDIMLSKVGLNSNAAASELRILNDLLRARFSQLTEIRWVVDVDDWGMNGVKDRLKLLEPYPTSFIRTSPNCDAKAAVTYLDEIRSVLPRPIKLSGSVTRDLVLAVGRRPYRVHFDMTYEQALKLAEQGGTVLQAETPNGTQNKVTTPNGSSIKNPG